MPLRQKKLLKFFITHKNQDLKKLLYGGGSFTAQQRHSLHSGGLVFIVEARSAQQIWEARICIAEAHGVRGFPPSLYRNCLVHFLAIKPFLFGQNYLISVLNHFKNHQNTQLNAETKNQASNRHIFQFCVVFSLILGG